MKKAGVDLLTKLGNPVKKVTPYAEFPADFKFARNLVAQDDGFVIGSEEQILKSLIVF
jgi:thymidine phosphorylase